MTTATRRRNRPSRNPEESLADMPPEEMARIQSIAA